ncbi:MAG: DNA-directed RNA polymerase subunit omega [Schwartzia sp.]|nr:DNA-directed RNA polymerase subunit omega [Schwartzia sp. (in: firmicutes)]MBR1760078.1 DNA-directed RNA polymerase subunit omega [Schwartzia sp. (in: firmicutes)]MBR1886196.1 DNA-directed RNA polymerase subunit omega [Schwartzia sp. (in: firmicutes)]
MDIVHPPMKELLTKVDSRYTLAVLAAKRARQLQGGAEVKVKVPSNKNVTRALAEVAADKIGYERTKFGVK